MQRRFVELVGVVASMWLGLISPAASANATETLRQQLNVEQVPFQIFGNTYYVGSHGLSIILITSSQGHILVNGGLPESVPVIAASVRRLGFKLEDIKLIVNSHAHGDHAGGIEELRHLTGAQVAASASAAAALKLGRGGMDDPQHASADPFPRVKKVRIVHDQETLHVSSLAITAYYTPGHTPGGTSWTWKSCEHEDCVNFVYADSLTAVSSPGFRFVDSVRYPEALHDFEHSFAVLETLPCDILLAAHPAR